eukprot:1957355-Pyramimonas_sp.AAC.1
MWMLQMVVDMDVMRINVKVMGTDVGIMGIDVDVWHIYYPAWMLWAYGVDTMLPHYASRVIPVPTAARARATLLRALWIRSDG